jgi:hypothetical protein
MRTRTDCLPANFLSLTRGSRLVSAEDVATVLQLPHTDSDAMLDGLVSRGLLRKTHSAGGQVFYWISGLQQSNPGGMG